MQAIDYSKVKEFDIYGTTSTGLFSGVIRFFETLKATKWYNFGGAWKAATKPDMTSHVGFFIMPVEGKFFGCEMIDRGITTDTSIKAEYLEKKGEKITGVRRLPEMDNPGMREMAKKLVYDLKEREMRYGWEEILRQAGMTWVKDKPNTMICSALVEYICSHTTGVSFGKEPDPLQVVTNSKLVKIDCVRLV